MTIVFRRYPVLDAVPKWLLVKPIKALRYDLELQFRRQFQIPDDSDMAFVLVYFPIHLCPLQRTSRTVNCDENE